MPLKLRALESLWTRFQGDAGFDAYVAREGQLLERYACFCVLAERHAGSWTSWPARFRRADSRAVRDLVASDRSRIDFHRWLQWSLDTQLAVAGRELPLVHDLAVGFAPDGADAWMWQDEVASGARIGAPSDDFNPAGQDWGVPPFDPARLRAAAYAPLVATMRRMMSAGVGLRIDHVMGLFRLWWVPLGSSDPSAGAYVRYPAGELLDILALESARAGCGVIGEDLGTVESGVRPELRRRGLLSYRLAWFESRPPRAVPGAGAGGVDHPRSADRRRSVDRRGPRRDGGQGPPGQPACRAQRAPPAADVSPVPATVTPWHWSWNAPTRRSPALRAGWWWRRSTTRAMAVRRPNLPGDARPAELVDPAAEDAGAAAP